MIDFHFAGPLGAIISSVLLFLDPFADYLIQSLRLT
jgi:hypothetical protein